MASKESSKDRNEANLKKNRPKQPGKSATTNATAATTTTDEPVHGANPVPKPILEQRAEQPDGAIHPDASAADPAAGQQW